MPQRCRRTVSASGPTMVRPFSRARVSTNFCCDCSCEFKQRCRRTAVPRQLRGSGVRCARIHALCTPPRAVFSLLLLGLAGGTARAHSRHRSTSPRSRPRRRSSPASPTATCRRSSGDMKKLGYDQYRALRAKPDTALWREAKGLFRVEFFPAGFIYERPVSIGIVENGNVTPVTDRQRPVRLQRHRPQGAAQGCRAGGLQGHLSAQPAGQVRRGDRLPGRQLLPRRSAAARTTAARRAALPIDTATGRPEEFPTFRSFWLVKPAARRHRAHGLGAARLARRRRRLRLHDPARARGPSWRPRPCCSSATTSRCWRIAPLTSMFFAGKASPPRDDYRPEIHDADGLFMLTGKGERIWRPLANPVGARHLVLRRHQPARLRPDAARARVRPVPGQQRAARGAAEPVGRAARATGATARCGWSRSRPRRRPTTTSSPSGCRAGRPSRAAGMEYSYRLSALTDEAALSPLARVVATRTGAVPGNGQGAPHRRRVRRRRARDPAARSSRSRPASRCRAASCCAATSRRCRRRRAGGCSSTSSPTERSRSTCVPTWRCAATP